jgi:hypothetical protein
MANKRAVGPYDENTILEIIDVEGNGRAKDIIKGLWPRWPWPLPLLFVGGLERQLAKMTSAKNPLITKRHGLVHKPSYALTTLGIECLRATRHGAQTDASLLERKLREAERIAPEIRRSIGAA